MTNTPKLIFTTLMTSIGIENLSGEQFLLVMHFKEKTYEKAGFDPTVLGRTLEDGGTVINYLPWGIPGRFVADLVFLHSLTCHSYFSVCFSPVFSMVRCLHRLGNLEKICETARSSKQDSAIRTIKT